MDPRKIFLINDLLDNGSCHASQNLKNKEFRAKFYQNKDLGLLSFNPGEVFFFTKFANT